MSDKPHPPTHNTSAYASDPIGYIIEHGAPPAKAGHAPQHAAPAHDGEKSKLNQEFDKAFSHPHPTQAPAANPALKNDANHSETLHNVAAASATVIDAANALLTAKCFAHSNTHTCDLVKDGYGFGSLSAAQAYIASNAKPKGSGRT